MVEPWRRFAKIRIALALVGGINLNGIGRYIVVCSGGVFVLFVGIEEFLSSVSFDILFTGILFLLHKTHLLATMAIFDYR